ncbi:MAG: hypothetical protein NZ602_06780 [Thermoguttaceae bacterium]|nr:hypothetical protein [Thermoguttaceae bacterium]MDW8038292.1 hypothetical protein [Thermoguttaceae bacterium]
MELQPPGAIGRDVCARCGSAENLEPFDYHAYARRTHYAELPRGWRLAEFAKLFQGRTVYHQLVQLSVLICSRCVWQMRCRRAFLWALGIGLLAAVAILAWNGYRKFMQDFTQAQQAMEQLERTRPPSSPRKELQALDPDRRRSRIFDEREAQLQRAKDRALLFALPLRAGSLVAMVLAGLAVAGALWDLRWERMGQRAAVAAVRTQCRRLGLKYVYPGHLPGGQPCSQPLP